MKGPVFVKTKKGKVYLVGAGPGDPDLLTLKGARVLGEADIVFYDYLANPKILSLASSRAQLVDVGKRHKQPRISQEEINQLIIKAAQKGKTVVRLKGGDSFLFGRGGEEAMALHQEGIYFEVVPGISSAFAVPAYAGIPLTHRELTADIAIVTGHEDPNKKPSAVHWEAAAQMGTVVLLMALGNLKSNLEKLMEHGKPPHTPSALISWGTYPKQKTILAPLSRLAEEATRCGFQAPSIVVVGDVVGLSSSLNWFEKRPLFGKKILVTRASAQAHELTKRLENLGASVIECPTVAMKPPSSYSSLDTALKKIKHYDWLLLTSVNGVNAFCDRLQKKKISHKHLAHLSLGAIGEATARVMREKGLWVDCMPSKYQAEFFIKALRKAGIAGKKVLIPRAQQGRDVLVEGLKEMRCSVSLVEAYRNVLPKKSAQKLKHILQNESLDILVFTSSSAVHHFAQLSGRGDVTVPIACLGPITAQTVRDYGWDVAFMPRRASMDALVGCLS